MRKKEYRIGVPTTGIVYYYAEAENEQEAKEIVLSGEADYDGEYEYDVDADINNWEVEIADEDDIVEEEEID